jgi:CHAT domain-containing protein/Tfp pilus assembly protein PilF
LRALAEEFRHRSEGGIHRDGRAVLAGKVIAMRCLLFLTLGTLTALFAQVGEQWLAPGATLPETLAGGDQRVYRLQVPAGQTVEVSLHEVQGMAGILSVAGHDGNEVVSVDFAKRNPGARQVLLGPGDFQLRLSPARHGPLERIFQLSAGLPRALAENDKLRFSAEQLMGSGEQILRTFQPHYLDDALAKYEAALDLWKRLEDRPRQADAWNHIGFVLHFQGKMNPAIDAYQQGLDLAKAEHDDGGAAAALFAIAFTDYDTAQYAKAAELATQALDLARGLQDWAGQSDALSVLGLASMARGESDQARARYLAMLAAAQKSGDPVREADAHNDLGLLEFQLANFVEGDGHYSHALAIYRQENEPVRVAQELNNLGVLYSTSGDPRKALRYFEEALPIRKTLAQPGSYANTIYNAAVSYAAVGDYQQALDGYNAALPIFRRVAHRSGEAYTLQELAETYIWLGENSRAEDLLRQGLVIRRAISDKLGEVQTLNVLADSLTRQHRYSEALQEYRESLSISHTAGYQRQEAQTLADLGQVLLRTGEPSSSLDSLTKSLDLSRKIGEKLAEASALHLEGIAWRRLAEPKRAREALNQALAIRTDAGARSSEADTLLELARLDFEEGLLPQSAAGVTDAISLVESMRANLGSHQSRMDLAASHRAFYELAIDIAMQSQDAGKAFEISERARARGLVDLVTEARLDLREGVDPALLERERGVRELLDAKHERLMRLLAANHSAARETADRREIDELMERYEAVETEIRVKSPQYAALTQPRPLTLAEIQALLPDSGTSLIEFWLGEKRSYVWIVSKTDCRGFALPPRAAVESLARRAYEALNARNESRDETLAQRDQRLKSARGEFDRAAASLSSQLFGPLGGALKTHRLWIVADGALAYVPFAALPVPGSPHALLLTGHEIVGLPSASVLAAVREQAAVRHAPDRMVAVFADPVFRANDERVTGHAAAAADGPVNRAAADSGVRDLPRLYFSRQEAEAIRSFAPPNQTRTALDFDASRAEAKKPDLARYRVVHFATHGLLDSRHPELSGIVLSMVDRAGQPQDGFLRLDEIYNLKLNADLVVLSACQTALGEEVRSEGLIGLTRGFMYAGSPQVLASLWSVRDRAVAELMRRFYESLLRHHLTPEAALRSAQLSMMQDPRWSDPYYWAAFVLQGSR